MSTEVLAEEVNSYEVTMCLHLSDDKIVFASSFAFVPIEGVS
ncbi:4469_t:CDS:1, partial [Paraglomus occultum]